MDREPGSSGVDPTRDDDGASSRKESTSDDRWRRLGDRSAALVRGAAEFWRRVRELWTRMANALHEEESRRPPVSQSSTPPRRRTERRDAPAPIRVSAQDRVFNFTVHASFTWSSDRLRREELSGNAHYYMPDAIARLTRLAAEHAGTFAPHRAADLQLKLQQVLSEESPWHYPEDDEVLECEPHVYVRPDERVIRIAAPYWAQLIRLEFEFEVRRKRAVYAEQLSRQVVTILENLAGSLAAGDCGQRTNENLASDVERLLTEHKAALRRLEDRFRETLRDSDIFGRATSDDIPKQRPDAKPSETPQPSNDPTATADSSGDPDQPDRD